MIFHNHDFQVYAQHGLYNVYGSLKGFALKNPCVHCGWLLREITASVTIMHAMLAVSKSGPVH